jgi:hypothetical protein
MQTRKKTDYCDACFEPWYPRKYDADGEPMDNICDDCAELMEEGHIGLSEDDERPPICSCGSTMAPVEDDDGEISWVCINDNCRFSEDY